MREREREPCRECGQEIRMLITGSMLSQGHFFLKVFLWSEELFFSLKVHRGKNRLSGGEAGYIHWQDIELFLKIIAVKTLSSARSPVRGLRAKKVHSKSSCKIAAENFSHPIKNEKPEPKLARGYFPRALT